MADSQRLLEIYLADHLAAATAGAALAHRSAKSNADSEIGDFLQRLTAEIHEDRRTLRWVVAELGLDESKVKNVVAWAAEKVARLKPNGQVRGYSPLSRVLELEALSVGVAGKLALWQALEGLPDIDQRLPGVDLEHLVQRARRQRADIEEHRIRAARTAFVAGAGSERKLAGSEPLP